MIGKECEDQEVRCPAPECTVQENPVTTSQDRSTERSLVRSVPTAMLIRVFGEKGQEPYGDIVHYNLKKPVPYQGAAQLVLKIDAISRSLDLPSGESARNQFRSVRRPRDETGNILPEEYWQEKEPLSEVPGAPDSAQDPDAGSPSPPRVRDTIYLQLVGRQHTSIQGRIWGKITRKKYVTFRSALELIWLLSEAV